jgi:hypothetical protein
MEPSGITAAERYRAKCTNCKQRAECGSQELPPYNPHGKTWEIKPLCQEVRDYCYEKEIEGSPYTVMSDVEFYQHYKVDPGHEKDNWNWLDKSSEDYTFKAFEEEPNAYSQLLEEWIKKPRTWKTYIADRRLKRKFQDSINAQHTRATAHLLKLLVEAFRKKNGKYHYEQFQAFYQRYILGKAPTWIRIHSPGTPTPTYRDKRSISRTLKRAERRMAKYLATTYPEKYSRLMPKEGYSLFICRMRDGKLLGFRRPAKEKYTEVLEPYHLGFRKYEQIPRVAERWANWKPEHLRITAKVSGQHPDKSSEIWKDMIIPSFYREVKHQSVTGELEYLRFISRIHRSGAKFPDPYRPRPKADLGYQDNFLTCNYPMPSPPRDGTWYSINGEVKVRGHRSHLDPDLPIEPWHIAVAA